MKNIFYLFILFLLATSCSSETEIIDNSKDLLTKPYTFKYEVGNDLQTNFYGKVVDNLGNAVSSAIVTIGNSTTKTTVDGFFEFKKINVKENFVLIKISKEGYVQSSKVLIPNNGENKVDVVLIPNTLLSSKIISSGTISKVSVSSDFKIVFDGSFEDSNGKNYSGQVVVNLYNLQSSNEYFKEIMPGSFLGGDKLGNPKFFESFSMIYVELKDLEGRSLQLAKGHTAEISLPIAPNQVATAPSSLSLMSYDEEKGYWKEEGEAVKKDNSYVGNVSHFSWWGTCLISDYCKLNFVLKDEQNHPKGFTPIFLLSANKTHYPNSITTNEKGEASIIAPASLPLKVSIYNHCKQDVFSKEIGVFTSNSINTVPLTLSISNPNFEPYVITGIVKDCFENLVSNGYVYLKPSIPNYFNYNYAKINNGVFTLNTYLCSINPSFILSAVDETNFKISNDIKFTAKTKNSNVGVLMACDKANEYITYQIDDGIVRNCLGDFSVDKYVIMFNGSSPFFVLDSNGLNSSNIVISLINNNGEKIVLSNQFNLAYLGEVGTYLDFSFEGVAKDYNGKTYNVKGKGHVIRDM